MRLATLLTATLVLTAAVVAPAAAASTETYLEGVVGVGDVVAGAGAVYVAAADRVVVADAAGTVTGAVTGLAGAFGLALSADGDRLFAALYDSGEIAEIDTGTLEVTRRVDLGANECPHHLALDGDRLWIGYGCNGTWSGGVLTYDTATTTPEVTSVLGAMYGPPVVAAAAGVLAVGETGLSPASFSVYGVDGATATLRGTVDGFERQVYNLTDLTITPDGSMVVAAFGSPYSHVGYDTTTLDEVRRYGDPSLGYPSAVAISPDGAYLAAGRLAGHPVLSVHRVSDAATVSDADSATGDLVYRALTFLGPDVFGVLHDWSAGRFYLWRVAGATLPHSEIALTPPASATVGEPLSIAGRLTPPVGGQSITVRRTLPDGTTSALAAVTTAADGSFTVTDTPPVGGDVRYDVAWAGNATYQGSAASVTVTVVRRAVSLTLTGPTTGVAGKRLRLTGTSSLPGGTHLAVYRQVFNNRDGGTSTRLADVVTDSRGGFRIDDTPTQGGRYVYTVRWDGSAVYEPAAATHEVSVTSTASQLTAVVEQPAYIGEPYAVGGGVSFDVGYCVGPTTVHVTRTVGSGPVEQRPDLTTDEACSFQFQDVAAVAGPVTYTFAWDGDGTHQGSAVTVAGTVQKQPSYVQAWARDHYLRSGEHAVIDGSVAGSRTGPLGTRLTVTVTRTDPAGATVRLRDITTATDGTFVLRDGPLRWTEGYDTAFVYEFSWAGTATYAASSTTDTVYLTPTG